METLVDSSNVKIQVRDTNGYCVCTKCRGGKQINYFVYYNPNSWGGLRSIVGTTYCPQCNGSGYWKVSHANV